MDPPRDRPAPGSFQVSEDDDRFIGYLVGCDWGELRQRVQTRWGYSLTTSSLDATTWDGLDATERRRILGAIAETFGSPTSGDPPRARPR